MNISLSEFRGTAPKINPRRLGNQYAQVSTNIKFDSGILEPVKAFMDVDTIASVSAIKSIYKYTESVSSDKWLYFNEVVNIVKDPINSYPDNRIIFTGLDCPRVCDSACISSTNVVDAAVTYKLGLPIPGAPRIAVSSVGDEYFESRTYTVQYDRVWADGKIDQGAYSSPAVTVSGDYFVDVSTNGSVLISNIADAPDGYGITHITINRSGTAMSDSNYHFTYTFNIEDAKSGLVPSVIWDATHKLFSVTDSVHTENLGSTCDNVDYIAPDANMRGLVTVSGGMLAGFVDNAVCFSEPYQPHAWPEQYKINIASKVIGLGSFGDIVVVCTDDTPYIIQITDPSAMVAFAIKDYVPCLSAESIVSYRDCVVYPSEIGIIKIDRTGVYNLTQSIATIADMKNFNLNNVKSAGMGSYYHMVYTDDNFQNKMLVFNMAEPEMGFSVCDYNIINVYTDFSSATLYVLYRNLSGVYKIGAYDSADTYLAYTWKSKKFVLPYDEINFSGARINFNTSLILDVPSTVDSTNLLPYGYNATGYNICAYNGYARATNLNYIMFDLYVDNILVFSKSITNTKPFRLPSGYIGREVEIVITSNIPVYSIDIATSFQELS